jgi:hypothetical protein
LRTLLHMRALPAYTSYNGAAECGWCSCQLPCHSGLLSKPGLVAAGYRAVQHHSNPSGLVLQLQSSKRNAVPEDPAATWTPHVCADLWHTSMGVMSTGALPLRVSK